MNKTLQVTADLIKNTHINIDFTLIEIGAVQVSTEKEPFYELLDHFPSSKIIGFEIDKEICNEILLVENEANSVFIEFSIGISCV